MATSSVFLYCLLSCEATAKVLQSGRSRINFKSAITPVSIGHFVKYDDVVHRWTPDTGRSRDVFVDSRKLAIGEFLPKWQGFYCASDVFLEPMLACEALTRLESVVNQLQQLSVRESIWHLRDWNPEEMNVAMVSFGIRTTGNGNFVSDFKILCDILKPKLEQLKSFKPTCKEKAAEKVVSAAAIAIVVKKHRIGLELSNDHLKSLAHSFSLEQSYYDAIKDTIQKNFSSIRFERPGHRSLHFYVIIV